MQAGIKSFPPSDLNFNAPTPNNGGGSQSLSVVTTVNYGMVDNGMEACHPPNMNVNQGYFQPSSMGYPPVYQKFPSSHYRQGMCMPQNNMMNYNHHSGRMYANGPYPLQRAISYPQEMQSGMMQSGFSMPQNHHSFNQLSQFMPSEPSYMPSHPTNEFVQNPKQAVQAAAVATATATATATAAAAVQDQEMFMCNGQYMSGPPNNSNIISNPQISQHRHVVPSNITSRGPPNINAMQMQQHPSYPPMASNLPGQKPTYQQYHPQKPHSYPAQQPLPAPNQLPQKQHLPTSTITHYNNNHFLENKYRGADNQPNVTVHHDGRFEIQGHHDVPTYAPSNTTTRQNFASEEKVFKSTPNAAPCLHSVKKEVTSNERRLTFPVKDGIILHPFKLAHNLNVSNHTFTIKPSIYQTLRDRPDLDLQFSCYHDSHKQVHWPTSVALTINNQIVDVDLTKQSSQKPLYVKTYCNFDENILQLNVSACICSYYFQLQLVHRPTISSVLNGLQRKRLLEEQYCKGKIREEFETANRAKQEKDGDGSPDCLEQTAVKISICCPITRQMINLPTRGNECQHLQCFDLEAYLHLNSERSTWKCPVCCRTALIEGLQIDEYLQKIIKQIRKSGQDINEITFDHKAEWRVFSAKAEVAEESEDNSANRKQSMSSPGLGTIHHTPQQFRNNTLHNSPNLPPSSFNPPSIGNPNPDRPSSIDVSKSTCGGTDPPLYSAKESQKRPHEAINADAPFQKQSKTDYAMNLPIDANNSNNDQLSTFTDVELGEINDLMLQYLPSTSDDTTNPVLSESNDDILSILNL